MKPSREWKQCMNMQIHEYMKNEKNSLGWIVHEHDSNLFYNCWKNTQIYVRTNPSNNEIHSITPMNNINAYMLRKTTWNNWTDTIYMWLKKWNNVNEKRMKVNLLNTQKLYWHWSIFLIRKIKLFKNSKVNKKVRKC